MKKNYTHNTTRILIVEDEMIVAADIKQRLEKLGYKVLGIVATGKTAIDKACKGNIDLILMDIRLKGKMDGIQTARTIQKFCSIPIVYLTAYADKNTLERAKLTQPFGYIIKPIEDVDLNTTIELALYKSSIEERLKQSERRFRGIFESANDAIVLFDDKGKILDANKKVKSILGYKTEELKGKSFLKLSVFNRNQSSDIQSLFKKIIHNLKSQGIAELTLKTKKKKTIYLEVSSAHLKGADNSKQYLAIMRDVTQRKKTEQALKKEQEHRKHLTREIIDVQERERLYLASEIHDDILQSLVAVLYFFQMIGLPPLKAKVKKQKDQLVDMIKSSIERGRSLISEIEPLRESHLGMVQIIKKSIEQKFMQPDINVHFDYPKRMPEISLLTKTNVIRIIQEALSNISKHTKATEVFIKISKYRNNFKIKIQDNGEGFDIHAVPGRERGHYGLLIMKERATIIGGKLMYKSKPGKGTTIEGHFPLPGV